MRRVPLVAPWTVPPVVPMVVALLLHPFVGWAWLAINAIGIRAGRRAAELTAVGVAFFGLFGVAVAVVGLAPDPGALDTVEGWPRYAADVWTLAWTMAAFGIQNTRWRWCRHVDAQADPVEVPTLAPEESAERVALIGRLREGGWLLEARAVAALSLAESPGDGALLHAAGQVERELGHRRSALALLRRAPPAPDVVFDIATTEILRKRWRPAEQALRDGLDRWPDDPDLLGGLAALYLEMGRLDAADAVLERMEALEALPELLPSLRAQLHARRGEHAAAEAVAHRALELDPYDPAAREALGGALASKHFLLRDWWRLHNRLQRLGEGWIFAPYVACFALYELSPLVEHPGPRRVGVLLAVLWAAFTIGGRIAYELRLRRALGEIE